jgi:hypothetical protein
MVEIDGTTYELEYGHKDPYITPNLKVAYCDQLATDYAPILYDPKGYGSTPFTPDILAYRLLTDFNEEKLCVLYEVYWRRQDCSWKELNKDHDHDYEQIQIQFDLKTGKKRFIISSVGPIECAGHGIELYTDAPTANFRNIEYITSPKPFFPWGGNVGQKNLTQIRTIPVNNLFLSGKRPEIIILNCYHAFVGVKRPLTTEEEIELKPKLERLNQKILDIWYYRHSKNRYGHDISKPFEDPFIMYYPPPEDELSRFVYGTLWIFFTIRRIFTVLFTKLTNKIKHNSNSIQTL